MVFRTCANFSFPYTVGIFIVRYFLAFFVRSMVITSVSP